MINKKIVIWGLLVVIWMIFIFVMSEMDANTSDDQSKTIAISIVDKYDKITGASPEALLKHKTKEFIEDTNYYFRKLSHAFVYLVLAILLMNFLIVLKKMPFYQYYLISIGVCFLYACTDEYHQTFINGRTGQFSDVLIDSIGALLGCIMSTFGYKLIMKRRKKKKSVK